MISVPPNTSVRSLDAHEVTQNDYLAVVYTVGYESRSTFIPRQASGGSHLVGFAFATQRVGAFHANLGWGTEAGSVVEVVSEPLYAELLDDRIRPLVEAYRSLMPDSTPRILVDISSMTRQRIADTARVLHSGLGSPVIVDWAYAPATFAGAASVATSRAIVTNAAIAGYEGWGDPSLPVTCVVGAGFEGDLALGVIDDIEPEDVWAFLPRGYSAEHDELIEVLNRSLLRAVGPGNVLEYRVDQPLETLLRLDAFLGGEIASRRVVLIPLGPKIFALVCALVALSAPDSVTMWRLSSETSRDATERAPDGTIVGLTVETEEARNATSD